MLIALAFTFFFDLPISYLQASTNSQGTEDLAAKIAALRKELASLDAYVTKLLEAQKGSADNKTASASVLDDDRAARLKDRKTGAKTLQQHKNVTKGHVSPHVEGKVCQGNETCIALAADLLQAFKTNFPLLTAFRAFDKKPTPEIMGQLNRVISESNEGSTSKHTLKMPGRDAWKVFVEVVDVKNNASNTPYNLSSLKLGRLYQLKWNAAQKTLKAAFTVTPATNVDVIVEAKAEGDADAVEKEAKS